MFVQLMCNDFALTMRRITWKMCVKQMNLRAAGEQQRERTGPGSNRFPHRRQSRPAGETESNSVHMNIWFDQPIPKPV